MGGPGSWRWTAFLIVALVLAPAGFAATTEEYRLKAAFVYKFATYVRWPPTSDIPAKPFVIGVIGSDPFGASLDGIVQSQTVNGRAVRIKRLSRLADILNCDLVFVSTSEKRNLPEILALLRDAPVLTVSDLDRFAESGGMIGLVTTGDNRIRFDINVAAVERVGLKASSQLLQLARIVDESRGRR